MLLLLLIKGGAGKVEAAEAPQEEGRAVHSVPQRGNSCRLLSPAPHYVCNGNVRHSLRFRVLYRNVHQGQSGWQLKRGALVAFNRQPISKIFTSFLLENPFWGFWMLLKRFLHVSGGSAASHGLLPIIPLLSHKPLDSK